MLFNHPHSPVRTATGRHLLNTTAVFQCSQQQFKIRKWLSSRTQKWVKHWAWKIPLTGKSKWIHVLLRYSKKKTEERKKVHMQEKGQDQCWTGNKYFSRAQANKLLMHYSWPVQLGTGTPLLERKKPFNILSFKTAESPQGKDWGKRLRCEASLQVKQCKRVEFGLCGGFFSF